MLNFNIVKLTLFSVSLVIEGRLSYRLSTSSGKIYKNILYDHINHFLQRHISSQLSWIFDFSALEFQKDCREMFLLFNDA